MGDNSHQSYFPLPGLRKARRLARLSTAELAKVCRVSVTTIYLYEQGRIGCPPARALQLSEAIGCTVATLADEDGKLAADILQALETAGPLVVERLLLSNLKQARIARELPREELARITGIPGATLYNYETGIQKCDIGRANKIASALGVTVEQLCGGDAPVYRPKELKRKPSYLLPGLLAIRLEAGASQAEVAAACGVSPRTYITWELLIGRTPAGKLEPLSAFFWRKAEDFFMESPPVSVAAIRGAKAERKLKQVRKELATLRALKKEEQK